MNERYLAYGANRGDWYDDDRFCDTLMEAHRQLHFLTKLYQITGLMVLPSGVLINGNVNA